MRVHDAPGPLDHGKGGWCPHCHLAWTEGQAAHCAGCCLHFSSDSAFDAHHTLDADGRSVCHDPATLTTRTGTPKLVNRDGAWGRPGSFPETARGSDSRQRTPAGEIDAYASAQRALPAEPVEAPLWSS